jgi:hypothetical protein
MAGADRVNDRRVDDLFTATPSPDRHRTRVSVQLRLLYKPQKFKQRKRRRVLVANRSDFKLLFRCE